MGLRLSFEFLGFGFLVVGVWGGVGAGGGVCVSQIAEFGVFEFFAFGA